MKFFEIDNLFDTPKTRENVAEFFFAIAVWLVTIEYTGFFMERAFSYDEKTLYIITAIGGIISLFVANHKRLLINLVCGPVLALGVAYGTLWYLEGRASVYKIEIFIPVILGIIPGLLAYYAMVKFFILPKENAGNIQKN